jgi:hypothetical protein
MPVLYTIRAVSATIKVFGLLFPTYIAVPMLYTPHLHEVLELRRFAFSIYSFPHPSIMHTINFVSYEFYLESFIKRYPNGTN